MDTLGGVTNVDFRFKMREAQKFFWDAFPKKKGHFEPKSASQGQKMLYGSLLHSASAGGQFRWKFYGFKWGF